MSKLEHSQFTMARRSSACAMNFLFIASWSIASIACFTGRGGATGPSAMTAGAGGPPYPQDALRDSAKIAAQDVPPAQQSGAVADPNDPNLAGRFAGRVVGPDGKPILRARVYIAPDDQKLKNVGPVRAETDAEGRFEFNAPDMTYTQLDGLPARRQGLLIAFAEGFAPDWMVTWGENGGSFRSHWDPVKGAEMTLRLAKDDVAIHGRLLGPDGKGLGGAHVRLIGLMVPYKQDLDQHLNREANRSAMGVTDYARQLMRPDVLPGITAETQTDAGGRFIMRGLGRDRLALLEVSAPSVVDTRITVMTRLARDAEIGRDDHGKPTSMIYGAGFILQLKPGRTITGVVRDRDTHEPIPGMWVGQNADAMKGLVDGDYCWKTDANGRFQITGLNPDIANQQIMAFPRPGQPYLMATAVARERSEVLIECMRSIPFNLHLVDERGQPIEAEVTYHDILPNPHVAELKNYDARLAINYAARKGNGTYEGFVLPGPGAVLVKMPSTFHYRPAHVDPKAFFAPGRTNWTKQDHISTYGNHDTLMINPGWWMDQHDYAAIVLVNPPVDSPPLKLSATVVRDKPRRVSLVDPEGNPVVGAMGDGLTFHPWDSEPRLRAATFSITRLHPDRLRRITFTHEDRKLIGFLPARGDGDTPYIVRMEPWATLTGRIVDENGQPQAPEGPLIAQQLPVLYLGNWHGIVTNSDPTVGEHPGAPTNAEGRFRLERMVPGLRYSAEIYHGTSGRYLGMAFENVVLQPGQVRDLGDIRTKPPVDVRGQ
jgi:hypothetical protein